MMNYCIDDVVQFNESHKWCGALGIVSEVSPRMMVGVPVPNQGTAYVFCKPEEVEYIGKAVLHEQMQEL